MPQRPDALERGFLALAGSLEPPDSTACRDASHVWGSVGTALKAAGGCATGAVVAVGPVAPAAGPVGAGGISVVSACVGCDFGWASCCVTGGGVCGSGTCSFAGTGVGGAASSPTGGSVGPVGWVAGCAAG